MRSPLVNQFEINPAGRKDYEKLAQYHYLNEPLGPCYEYHCINPIPAASHLWPDVIGICIVCLPIPNLRARNIATKNFFLQPSTPSERLKLLNRHVRYLARLIIDPRFRRLGLATWLHNYVIKHQSVCVLETIMPIGWSNKILLNSGFQQHNIPKPPFYTRLQNALRIAGIPDRMYEQPSTIQLRIDSLEDTQRQPLDYEMKRFAGHFKAHADDPPGPGLTKYCLYKLAYPNAYFIRGQNTLLP